MVKYVHCTKHTLLFDIAYESVIMSYIASDNPLVDSICSLLG